MLGLGLASSHAPTMFRDPEQWPVVYRALIGNVPQPLSAAAETPEVCRQYAARCERAFTTLRERLVAYRPDVLIVVGDDQGACFPADMLPQLCVYTGEEISGGTRMSFYGEDPKEGRVSVPCAPELARYLVTCLVKDGFDVVPAKRLYPPDSGPFAELGPHAIIHPMPSLVPALDIPVIPIFVNAYFMPAPSGRRCYEFGAAIAEALNKRTERVAIYASGGLSHDPLGPRAGWIDEKLDRWVLARLAEGDGRALQSMFDQESAALSGGTGEIRQWIVAAGACEAIGRHAEVVDYMPVHHGTTGIGFAVWQ